jgi:phosphate transport system permease protein
VPSDAAHAGASAEAGQLVFGARPYNRPARVVNALVIGFCWSAALLTIGALFYIFGYVVFKGITSVNLAFFTNLPAAADRTDGGMRNAIAGTGVLITMASCIGIPMGMLCGIFLSEYSRGGWYASFIRLVVDVLAGVPSIIVGVVVYELVVVHAKVGFSAWAGAAALGIMMCPIIARTTEEILKLVPQAYREASVGVGASRFQTLFRVVLPAARGGIITGIMLAVARVAGETAPLLFTALGSGQPIFSFGGGFPYVHAALDQAFPSLTVQIFQYATTSEQEWVRQAWAGMLVLIVLVSLLNLAVRFASRSRIRRG